MKKIYDLSLIERNDVAENTIELIFTKPSDYDFKTRCLEIKNGDSATVTKATGSFGFKFSDKEIVFLISGIGIAPIIPMLMELEKINYQGKVSLFYSNRTLAKTTYHERLQDFNIKNYNYNPVFTGIQPRINIDLLKEKLDDIYDAHYYIIGTGEFIKTMKTLLEENHIDRNHYLVDNFG